MTSTEPMTYKPGPELNKLIASKLFKFEVHDSLPIMWEDPDSDFKSIPDYSSTWEGMSSILEFMRQNGWHWGVYTYKNRFTAELIINGSVLTETADSAPQAVCLACLSALQHVSNTEELDKDEVD